MIILEEPMARKHFTEDFRKEAVRLALNSGLVHISLLMIFGLRCITSRCVTVTENGHSTLSKWISAFRHDDLMVGPHDDRLNAPQQRRLKITWAVCANYLVSHGLGFLLGDHIK